MAGVTRQIALPTSSATSNAPARSTGTPTGRPKAWPFVSRKPVRTSSGGPDGRPSAKGTKITLYPLRGLAVPGAMLADEGAARVALRQQLALIEGEPERGGVGTERVVGDDDLRHGIGALRLDPWVEVLPEIAIGPAVKPTVLQSGHIVRDEVAAELVPFVDHGPELAVLRLPGESVRIAQAGRKHPRPPRHWIDFEDPRPALLIPDAVLPGVAVGPDGHVKMRAVGARDDVLGQ